MWIHQLIVNRSLYPNPSKFTHSICNLDKAICLLNYSFRFHFFLFIKKLQNSIISTTFGICLRFYWWSLGYLELYGRVSSLGLSWPSWSRGSFSGWCRRSSPIFQADFSLEGHMMGTSQMDRWIPGKGWSCWILWWNLKREVKEAFQFRRLTGWNIVSWWDGCMGRHFFYVYIYI